MTQTRDTRAGDRYAGHTPGPWGIGYGGMDGDDYATITSKFAHVPVCELTVRNPHDVGKGGIGISRNQCHANARLIAAAPKLLAENRRLRKALEGLTNLVQFGVEGEYGHDACDYSDRLREARAALADTEVES